MQVYNRDALNEKYQVVLQIAGRSAEDEGRQSLAFRHSIQFLALEGVVIEFIQRFNRLWGQVDSMFPVAGEKTPALSELDAVQLRLFLADPSMPRRLEEAAASQLSAKLADARKQYSSLFFEYRYITDELVFNVNENYSRSGSSGKRFAFKLAAMHFSFVMKHRAFRRFVGVGALDQRQPGHLQEWVDQLRYFLGYIPLQSPATEVLFDLMRELDHTGDA